MKRGVTLIELTVSMGIFTIIATLAIGAFVSVSRMKAMTTSMRETQQKVRVATETISRLAKQATAVTVSTDNQSVILTVDGGTSMSKFAVENNRLNYYKTCPVDGAKYPTCTDWGTTPEDMLSGIVELDTAGTPKNFEEIINFGQPELRIYLPGKAITIPDNSYYPNTLNVDTHIILESLK